MTNQDKMALVGMACRLPDANSVAEFWQNLVMGTVSTRKERQWDDNTRSTSGFLDTPNHFDASFFNISPNEARCMSPQLRQLLEVSYQAIESSGLTIKQLQELNTGVFCSSLPGDYKNLLAQNDAEAINPYSFSGNALSALSGRLSYYYDFHGPSVSIDTACSSGLSALHMAQLSIRNGDCDAALVGAASIFSTSEFHTLATSSQMLSKNYVCATFDEQADGFVASEGVVCLVLISAEKAREFGLPVYGFIKEISLNHNGLSNGLMAPNAKQQEQLIRKTYQKAGLSLNNLALYETHGTATKLGDSIEMRGLSNALDEELISECYIGSSKMVIGHCLVSSALASIIKVALSHYHQIIPPNPLFKKISPLISVPANCIINTNSVPWPKDKTYAGISAFGFTGSNGHLIMEFEAHDVQSSSHEYQHYYLFSAASPKSLIDMTVNLSTDLLNGHNYTAEALSLRLMRRPLFMKYRLAIHAEDLEQLKESLKDVSSLLDGVNQKVIILSNKKQELAVSTKIQQWLLGTDISFDVTHCVLEKGLLSPYPFDHVAYHVQRSSTVVMPQLNSNELQICKGAVAEILSYQVHAIDINKSLAELGIDSLSALTLINKLKEHGYEISAERVWSTKSLQDFAKELVPMRRQVPNLEPKIDVPGMRLRHQNNLTWLYSENSGEQLILLPPLNSDYKAWLRQIPMLLKLNYQLHIPFYTGHGLERLEQPLLLTDLAKNIADYAHSLKDKSHFIGWSLGGVLSILVAIKNKELIKSMSLVACSIQFDGTLFEKTIEMQSDLLMHHDLLQIALQTEQPISDYISSKTSMIILKDYYQELMNLSLSDEELAAIDVPTQIILGQQDPVIREQQIERLKMIPHQACTIFEKAGHFIPLTFAAEFNQLIVSFLKSVERDGRTVNA